MIDFINVISFIEAPLVIIGALLAVPLFIYGVLKFFYNHYTQRKKFNNTVEEADRFYSTKRYEAAFDKYQLITQEFDESLSHFIFGEIYSKMGHCLIEIKSNQKNWEKINEGIEYYNKALEKYNISKYPLKAAVFKIITIFISNVIVRRVFNVLKLNIDKSYIKILNKLKICKYIFRFGGTKIDLGVAYCRLAEIRNSIDNFERAINEYKDALKIFSFERFPIDHKIAIDNLIPTYLHLSKFKDSEKNFRLAQELISDILFKLQKMPELINVKEGTLGYAKTQFRTGCYLMEFFERDPNNSFKYRILKGSIYYYLSALAYFNVEDYSYEYAMIQNNLGIAYDHLSLIEDVQVNSQKAIKSFEDALIIRTKEKYPIEYVQTMHNLGHLYGELGQIEINDEKSIDYLRKSIEKLKNALAIRNIESFPLEFSETQHVLAVSYFLLATRCFKIETMKKETLSNLNESMNALNWSLKVSTKEKYEMQYSELQYLRGEVYSFWADIENRESNLKSAIVAYKEVESIKESEKVSKKIDDIEKKLRR
jgi:tetratricopeptide (TPR) repeat protein